MNCNRIGFVTALVGFTISAYGQTPPVQPNVQEVPTPPPVSIPGPTSVLGDVNKPITAAEAAAVALKYQQSLTVSLANALSAAGRAEQAKAAANPSLGLTAGYSRSETFTTPSGGGSNSGGSSSGGLGFTAGATIKQLIFDFNHTRAQIRQAAALQGAAESDYTRAQADLVLQVKQAYYTLVANTHLVKVSEANLTSRTNQLALARARLNAGVGQPADLVSAEANESDAQQNLVQARAAQASSQISLALFMGIDPRTPIDLADSREPIVAEDDMNGLVNLGLKQRPEIRTARQNLDASGFGLSAARSLNAPSLSLNLNASGRGRTDPIDGSSGVASLALTWPLLDGGLQSGAIKVAKAGVQSSNASLILAGQQVISDVTQAYLALKSAEQRKVITAAQVVNATEGVRIAQGRYQAGLGTFVDVTTAQALLVSAQTNDVNADASLDQARASMAHAIGQPVKP